MTSLKIKIYQQQKTLKNILVPVSIALSLSGCATTADTTQVAQKLNVFNQINLADQAYDKGQWVEAERHYQIVINRAPKDAYAWFRLANTYLRQGEYARAIHAYESTLQRSPEHPRAYYNMSTAYLLKARVSLQSAYNQLPPNDAARAMIEQKLKKLKEIAYTAIEEEASPADGLIKSINTTPRDTSNTSSNTSSNPPPLSGEIF